VSFDATKVYGAVEIQLHSFLTLALDASELSTSCSGSFTLVKDFRCPLRRRLGGLQSRSEGFGEIKKFVSPRNPSRILAFYWYHAALHIRRPCI